MAKGETDYEIWAMNFENDGERGMPPEECPSYIPTKKLAVCDTQVNAIKKLARLKWPKNGLAIIPVRRKK